MSRSYKKTPVLKDSNTSKKTSKRMANKITPLRFHHLSRGVIGCY